MMGFSAFAQTAFREGVTFKGKADADCVPRRGNYHYPATEATVSIENRSITKIVNPAADRARAKMQQTNDAHTATTCNRWKRRCRIFKGKCKQYTRKFWRRQIPEWSLHHDHKIW